MYMPLKLKRNCILLLTLIPATLTAQTAAKDSLLNRTVVVEQEYNPEIMDASKINRLPQVETPSVPKQAIEYSLRTNPITSFQTYQPLETYALQESETAPQRGYVRIGYGNRNNLDGRISYAFRLSSKDELSVSGNIRGMKGNLKFPSIGKAKHHDYRTRIGLDYRHFFSTSEMNLSGHWHLLNLGLHPQFALSHQRFTRGDIHWQLKSFEPSYSLQFAVEANWNIHQRIHNWLGNLNEETKGTEHQLYTHAWLNGEINDSQHIGLDIKMHNFIYPNGFFTDYTSLSLNPFYEIENANWKLHAGIHIDPSFGFGRKFQVAPDVNLSFTFAEHYQLYARAEGGRKMNDFNHLAAFCPYANLQPDYQLANTYEQLNASIGFKASPCNNFHWHLFGGYQNLKDDIFTYWQSSTAELCLRQANGSNFYGGATIQYTYKDFFNWYAQGSYHHWDMCDDALFFKPMAQIHTNVDIHPIKPLHLRIGYTYQKPQQESANTTVHNLTAGATYTLHKGLSVYATVNNIFNRTYFYHWNYPEQGIGIIGGISFKF